MALILVTNDDGVHAAGVAALAEALEELGEVWVIAPEREQSACGHALTLHRPVRAVPVGERRFAVSGTPSDCVNLGVLGFMPERPVLVASGINHGGNLGDDVTYSGTISAAFEGALLEIPSIALSALVGEHFSFDRCAAFALELTRWALEHARDPNIILNVNFPVGAFAGVRITKLGKRTYGEGVIERIDPRGRKYYWIGGEPPIWQSGEGTDFEAVNLGYVSITPLHLDMTHHESIARLKPLEESLGHFAKG